MTYAEQVYEAGGCAGVSAYKNGSEKFMLGDHPLFVSPIKQQLSRFQICRRKSVLLYSFKSFTGVQASIFLECVR